MPTSMLSIIKRDNARDATRFIDVKSKIAEFLIYSRYVARMIKVKV